MAKLTPAQKRLIAPLPEVSTQRGILMRALRQHRKRRDALTEKMAAHDQVWVKVNAQVDAGIAEIISLLNRIDGLETLQSCQGFSQESPAYVFFRMTDADRLCEFAFKKLAPGLPQIEEVSVSVEAFGGSNGLMGKLRFSAEATPFVTAALKRLVNQR